MESELQFWGIIAGEETLQGHTLPSIGVVPQRTETRRGFQSSPPLGSPREGLLSFLTGKRTHVSYNSLAKLAQLKAKEGSLIITRGNKFT